jgi:hypothetical protein
MNMTQCSEWDSWEVFLPYPLKHNNDNHLVH